MVYEDEREGARMKRRDFIRSSLIAGLAAATPATTHPDDVVVAGHVFEWAFDDHGDVDAQVLIDRCSKAMRNTLLGYNVVGYRREPSWSCTIGTNGIARYKLRCRAMVQVDSEGQPIAPWRKGGEE